MPGVYQPYKVVRCYKFIRQRLSVAVRLLLAVKISCMVERTMIMGGDLLGDGRKIIFG